MCHVAPGTGSLGSHDTPRSRTQTPEPRGRTLHASTPDGQVLTASLRLCLPTFTRGGARAVASPRSRRGHRNQMARSRHPRRSVRTRRRHRRRSCRCVCVAASAGYCDTPTHSQARLTRRAEMRAILALAQVLVAAAAAARSVERDAAPATALVMVSVCAPHLVPCPASREMPPFAARVRPLQANEASGSSVAASSTALVAVASAAAVPGVSARLCRAALAAHARAPALNAQPSPHPRAHRPPMTRAPTTRRCARSLTAAMWPTMCS